MATNNILVPIIIDDSLLSDPLTEGGESLLSLLETAWNSVTEMLHDFAQSLEFAAKMELAFGQGVNVSELQQAWTRGEVRFPTIEIVAAEALNGAKGAFARATGKIYSK